MSALEYEPGNKLNAENYHHDPGDVNVHQFYPVLEYTFSKQLVSTDEELFRPIADKDSRSEHTDDVSQERSTQTHILSEKKQRDDGTNEEAKNEETGKFKELEEHTDLETEYTTEQLKLGSGAKDKNVQDGLFSTAVNEESIEAAKQRSQNYFFAGDRHQRKNRHMRIFTKRANEHFQHAMRMKEDKNPVGIIMCLTKAINLKSDDSVFYVERGEAYLSLCDFQSAIINYRKACLLAANSPVYHSRLAFLYYFQGQTLFDQQLFSEALEAFSRASGMVPGNFGYHMRCIACLAALQRHEECLALVNQRLEEDKDNPDLYILRARLHEIFANASLYCRDVRDALRLDPQHPEGQTMMAAIVKRANSNKLLAMQLSIVGKDREALQKMSLAIQTNPSVADYHVLRGAMHRKLKDFNSAVDDFLLALDKCGHKEEDPVYKNSQRQLLLTFNDFAVECFNKGCYQDAITLLNKALKEEKNEKSLYVNRGDCFFKQNELSFALQDYQQALELDPQDHAVKLRISLIYNEFGVSLFQEKNYNEAESKFTLALEYSPQVGQFYISRSRARYMLENLTGARLDCLQGLLLSPNNDGVTSIVSRLFPGKSVADIINSAVAQDVKIKLNSLVTANSTDERNLPGLSDSSGAEGDISLTDPAGAQAMPQFEKTWEPAGSSKDFIMCMEDKEFYVKQVKDKLKVDHKVKDALFNRKSLRNDGPQLLPLPPPIFHTHVGTFKGQGQLLTSAAGKEKSFEQKGTNWRKFGLTIGGSKNVI